MSIELLNVDKNWAKVKAGFRGDTGFNRSAGTPKLTFTNGVDASAQKLALENSNKGSSPFTGKTFSARK